MWLSIVGKRLRGAIGVLFVALVAAISAQAQTAHLANAADWPVCVTFNSIDRGPKNILNDLNQVETLVPTVPPEEAAYLEKETKAAMEAQAEHRFNAAAARPYYLAWQIHNEFARARASLDSLKLNELSSVDGSAPAYNVGTVKEEISRSLSLFADLQAVSVAWHQFAEHMAWQPEQRTLVENSFYYMNGGIVEELREYIDCLRDLPMMRND